MSITNKYKLHIKISRKYCFIFNIYQYLTLYACPLDIIFLNRLNNSTKAIHLRAVSFKPVCESLQSVFIDCLFGDDSPRKSGNVLISSRPLRVAASTLGTAS